MASSKTQDGADPVYAQPNKMKPNDNNSNASNGEANSHYHAAPDQVQLGKTVSPSAVVGGDQMHGQLLGEFDENGLPLVAKGDCAACGQNIVGQVGNTTAGSILLTLEHKFCFKSMLT